MATVCKRQSANASELIETRSINSVCSFVSTRDEKMLRLTVWGRQIEVVALLLKGWDPFKLMKELENLASTGRSSERSTGFDTHRRILRKAILSRVVKEQHPRIFSDDFTRGYV